MVTIRFINPLWNVPEKNRLWKLKETTTKDRRNSIKCLWGIPAPWKKLPNKKINDYIRVIHFYTYKSIIPFLNKLKFNPRAQNFNNS
jgi:hypothetical protein